MWGGGYANTIECRNPLFQINDLHAFQSPVGPDVFYLEYEHDSKTNAKPSGVHRTTKPTCSQRIPVVDGLI
jgi:hypothetical protein